MTPGGARDGVALACGVDVIELEGWKRQLDQGGPRFLEKYYTRHEREWCEDDACRLAGRFAAKEAVVKALGTGFRGVEPVEVEVVTLEHGQPTLRLHGEAEARARALGLDAWRVSLSQGEAVVVAFVVAWARSAPPPAFINNPSLDGAVDAEFDFGPVASVYVPRLVAVKD